MRVKGTFYILHLKDFLRVLLSCLKKKTEMEKSLWKKKKGLGDYLSLKDSKYAVRARKLSTPCFDKAKKNSPLGSVAFS